ncbi:MAG: ATP-dependent DNA helicase RecG [Microgenomates group bacterium]|nr:ATP-dependent DNA helicase RecG [Microgenomates group bacterium]
MNLDQPLNKLPFTKAATVYRMKKLGLATFWDLINYFPFRYENYSLISPIAKIQPGENVTLKGVITKTAMGITKRGLKTQQVVIDDGSGSINLVWYNQPYLLKILKPGFLISVAGQVSDYFFRRQFTPSEYEILKFPSQPTIHTGRIVPIYPETQGLSSKTIREKIFYILSNLKNKPEEFLPEKILLDNQLFLEFEAYKKIHFPQSMKEIEPARHRLSFDELFLIQLSAALTKKKWQKEKASFLYSFTENCKKKLENFIARLPFELTNSQKKAWQEIFDDLNRTFPMNRFLQGDVGAGKTVVAAIASYYTFLNHYQTLFMAPTEILAEQHYQIISNLLKKEGVKIALITGSKKPASNINDYDLIIGTHALISKNLQFHRVGLVIIDEQQRFGVQQRLMLQNKGVNPHLLTMTATPIPRTVALTLYGELDLSTIDELPKGRIPVKTYLVPKEKRDDCYNWIKKKINQEKIQIFIICPLIEESEKETMASVKAAKKEYQFLKENVFTNFNLGLLHGRLRAKEKTKLMNDFKEGRIDILIATSVVEVGIDIPNATVMIIEAAERYGLAQLHQLRGRIGRGNKQAFCFLFTEKTDERIIARLNFFAKNNNGSKIAEYDLHTRGPGEIFGVKQHGYINLKIASLSDFSLINKTKKTVNFFLNKYSELIDQPKIKNRLQIYNFEAVSRD